MRCCVRPNEPAVGQQLNFFAALYRELHRVARRQLHARAPNATLGATTLLHKVYLQLEPARAANSPNRARFSLPTRRERCVG